MSFGSIRAWAQRLLAAEEAVLSVSDQERRRLERVSDKLRISITEFVGAVGFTALLRRALALARVEVSSLRTAKVTPDGRIEGLEKVEIEAGNDIKAAMAITEHLLELMVTFIGEPVTLRLMSKTFPETSLRAGEVAKDL